MEEMIPEKADFDQHTWGRCHGKAGEVVLEPENSCLPISSPTPSQIDKKFCPWPVFLSEPAIPGPGKAEHSLPPLAITI
jgi:hypothetical protein